MATTTIVYLPDRPAGALNPSLRITWQDEDGEPQDLTNATLTGLISDAIGDGGTVRAIAGLLDVVDAENGAFRWDLHEDDIPVEDVLEIQIVADYPSGPTPAKSLPFRWRITRALELTP